MLNQLVMSMMPIIPKGIIKGVAKKYIAGSTLDDAVKVTQDFAAKGGRTTIDLLGEFVDSKEMAIHERGEIAKILDAVITKKLPTYLSIKPTSLGMGIDFDFGYQNAKELVQKAKDNNIFVRLDMENAPYTEDTIKMYKRFREEGFNNIGIVIQAYLFRSEKDIIGLKDYKPNIRLCKGIYKEAADIAFQSKDDIRNNYKKLLPLILENGGSMGIATHDDILINFAMNYLKEHKIPKDRYEFQMLLGVRENKRYEILKMGHNMRIYVPFGEDWYGYSTRRLQESPDMASKIFKAMFTGAR